MKSFTAKKMLKCELNGEIYGEDGPPIAIIDSKNHRFMIGAFDGMGGRGSTKCIDQRTQAHHGAHAVSQATREYFEQKIDTPNESFDQSELERVISEELKNASSQFKRPEQSKLKGKLSTNQGGEFPTTAVITHNLSNQLELLWAGDSRAYGLFESGFFPLTQDHVSDFKLYPVSSSPLQRYLHTDSSKLESKFIYQNPIALIVCSDGLFDAHPYPSSLAGDITTIFHSALTQKADLNDQFDKYLKTVTWSDDVSISGVLLREDDQAIEAIKKLYEKYQSASHDGKSLRDELYKQRHYLKITYELGKELKVLREDIDDLENKEKRLNSQLNRAKENKESTEKEIDDTKVECEKLCSSLEQEIPQDSWGIERITIDSSDEVINRFKKMLADSEEYHEVHSRLEELNNECKDYTNKKNKCAEIKNKCYEQIYILNEKIRDMANKIRGKVSELNKDTQSSIDQDVFKCFEKLPIFINELNELNDEYQTHVKKLRKCRQEINDQGLKSEEYNKRITELEKKIGLLEKRKTEIEGRPPRLILNNAFLKLGNLFKRICGHRNKLGSQRQCLEDLIIEIEERKGELKELEKEKNEKLDKEYKKEMESNSNDENLKKTEGIIPGLHKKLKECTDVYLESFVDFKRQEQELKTQKESLRQKREKGVTLEANNNPKLVSQDQKKAKYHNPTDRQLSDQKGTLKLSSSESNGPQSNHQEEMDHKDPLNDKKSDL